MKQRKLFNAYDPLGNLVFINNANKSQTFSCPHCRQPVIPKQGDNKTWHFSHKDGECSQLRTTEATQHKNINEFTNEFKENIEFKMDCKNYQCPVCKKVGAKEFAVKWKDQEFICKDCFMNK